MAYTHYDRLTALDASFLDLESTSVHMHVGSIGIFDPGPLADESGGVDFDRVIALTEAGLLRVPRFRQRLATTPLTGDRIWVDDEHFNLLYHLRHTALPRPGDERQLKRLFGRIMSEKLDRSRPMWEMWIVEGCEDGRVALISKVHHCLIDGISGVDLLSAFMGFDPDYRASASDHRWMPRPAPGWSDLAFDEVRRRASIPLRLLSAARSGLTGGDGSLKKASHAASGFVEGISKAMKPASETPLNAPIGPHRRFDWTRFDLSVVQDVKKKLGGTVNDVVLGCVAGAVRRLLHERGFGVEAIDFRAFVPVSTRAASQRGKLGNRVSMVIANLPVDEPDPRKRMSRISEETRAIKASGQIDGAEGLEGLADWTSPGLLTSLSRMASERRAYNVVVTNVPGPPGPVYLDGSRMLASYPLVPLFEQQTLGIALFSYDGGLFWGFNACWDHLPELHDFVRWTEQELETLRSL